MNFEHRRGRAALLREVPLESVLISRGAERDSRDKSKWHTERGPVSISGSQFMNWWLDEGGGGAIDLVMHLAEADYATAEAWLEQHFGAGHAIADSAPASSSLRHEPSFPRRRPLQLPPRDDRMLGRARRYLSHDRRLSPAVFDPLLECGRIYADARGNVVFLLMRGRPNQPVGAELRGTGPVAWRGMASGTCKNRGFFWIGPRETEEARELVLCESAIDAISCYHFYPDRICISTSGVRANPPWLRTLLARGYTLHCGFDNDDAGNAAAGRMMKLYRGIQRLSPSAHDWNDILTR